MNFLVNASFVPLLQAARRTATANGAGVDMLDYEGSAIVVLDCGAIGGTSPTLDVRLQESDTSGGTYTDVAGGGYTQITAAGTQKLTLAIQNTKRWIRVASTIGGTTPTPEYGVYLVAQKKTT